MSSWKGRRVSRCDSREHYQCRKNYRRATLPEQYVGTLTSSDASVPRKERPPIWYDGVDNWGPTLASSTQDFQMGFGIDDSTPSMWTYPNGVPTLRTTQRGPQQVTEAYNNFSPEKCCERNSSDCCYRRRTGITETFVGTDSDDTSTWSRPVFIKNTQESTSFANFSDSMFFNPGYATYIVDGQPKNFRRYNQPYKFIN